MKNKSRYEVNSINLDEAINVQKTISASAIYEGQVYDIMLHAWMGKMSGWLSPALLGLATFDWLSHYFISPAKQLDLTHKSWKNFYRHLINAAGCYGLIPYGIEVGCIESRANDHRFRDDLWKQLPFQIYAQNFLLYEQWWNDATSNIRGVSKHHEDVVNFTARQLLDMFSPSNFPSTNPEIIKASIAEGGANFARGYHNLIEDLYRIQNNLSPVGTEKFKVGIDVAITPGYVVYQNDLMQLIQYSATTDKIYQYPLLIVPPWINKYYILDLQKENSLVKWLVDQGFSVFMISWVNPTNQHKEKEFSDYMIEGPIKALEMIKVITGPRKINLLGYCIGGTLLGCMLAYLAKTNDGSISSATFLTTLLDFSEPGELGVFIDEYEINLLEKNMKINGYLDGRIMASVFNALKANDLIWSSFINKYLKGHKPKPFDFLFWNSDSTNIPEKVHSFYLRNMYLNNNLSLPDKLQIANTAIDLSKISIPCYFLATKDDHIVPWKTSYKSKHLLNGSVKFVLAGSGHVAGVVNPPNKNKYGYWTHPNPPKNPEKFLAKATYHEGSWWINWVKWIKKYSGKCTTFSSSNFNNQIKLENAPGSYVKKKIKDIIKKINELNKIQYFY